MKGVLYFLFLIFSVNITFAQEYPVTTTLKGDSVVIMTTRMVNDINKFQLESKKSLNRLEKEKEAYKIAMQYNATINKGDKESDSLKQHVMDIAYDFDSGKKVNYDIIKPKWIDPNDIFPEQDSSNLEVSAVKLIESLPKSYDKISVDDMKSIAEEIDEKIKQLQREKEELIRLKASDEEIAKKEESINQLNKEKNIVDLNIKTDELKTENLELESDKSSLKKIVITTITILTLLILFIIVFIQRNKLLFKDKDILKKNTFLNYAAKLIRHDMHSGINTYIPRGLSTLEKRLTEDQIKELRIETSLSLIKNGLEHTQRVYNMVHQFTDLVKENSQLDKKNIDMKDFLESNLETTSYSSKVDIVGDMCQASINNDLFWFAINTFIKRILKKSKSMSISEDGNKLILKGEKTCTKKEFKKMLMSYDDAGSDVRIAHEIIKRHGFNINFFDGSIVIEF